VHLPCELERVGGAGVVMHSGDQTQRFGILMPIMKLARPSHLGARWTLAAAGNGHDREQSAASVPQNDHHCRMVAKTTPGVHGPRAGAQAAGDLGTGPPRSPACAPNRSSRHPLHGNVGRTLRGFAVAAVPAPSTRCSDELTDTEVRVGIVYPASNSATEREDVEHPGLCSREIVDVRRDPALEPEPLLVVGALLLDLELAVDALAAWSRQTVTGSATSSARSPMDPSCQRGSGPCR
jgi:hypothetical protein